MFDVSRRWPSFERWTIGVQLARAALSVGANIAEARGRLHEPDERRFLIIARGSLLEARHWLWRAEAAGLTDGTLARQTNELGRTLNGLIRSRTPNA